MTDTTNDLDQERADIIETLQANRRFLRYTVAGLDDQAAAKRTTVSELCLGGIVKHVTRTEEAWVRFIHDGPSAMAGFDEAAMAAHAASFRMLEGETLADAAQYARRKGVPLYTVALGSEKATRDLVLSADRCVLASH